MAEIKEQVEDENKIDTVIADDIHFTGTLSFKKSLKIKGAFEGKIESEGHLIVGQEAKVHADIKANVISVSGSVKGKLKADQRVELNRKSSVQGDIITPDLSMENGSLFNGTSTMTSAKKV